MRRKVQLPAQGRIKGLTESVNVIGEQTVAGIPCYVVKHSDGDVNTWRRDVVVVQSS